MSLVAVRQTVALHDKQEGFGEHFAGQVGHAERRRRQEELSGGAAPATAARYVMRGPHMEYNNDVSANI